MKQVLSIQKLTRREFLCSAAALPALTCVFPAALRANGLAAKPAAPYLELKKFILPGQDEFAAEAEAFRIHDLLVEAFHSKQLPGGTVQGSSPRRRRIGGWISI